MTIQKIGVMVLRICGVLALILGILFWVEVAPDSLIPVHMLLGILVVLSLWLLGGLIGMARGGNWGLAIGAIVLGIILFLLGLRQKSLLTGDLHWLIQVLHLLLGVAAIGMGEMISARYKRLNTVPVAEK